jgi:ribosomal protein RSM22 (predicted rRNA methylase)
VTHNLLEAADGLLHANAPSDLAREYAALSDRYRRGLATPRALTRAAVLAYAAARLPATLAATARVLADLRVGLPDWRPRTALDLGAGLGSAGWAAAAAFPSIEHVTFVERNEEMRAVGAALAITAELPAVARAAWLAGDATSSAPKGSRDLVLGAYVLGELPERERRAIAGRWWEMTAGCLVLIEPGTPDGYRRLIDARRELIDRGATIAAPCPHDGACPLTDGDWCHFMVRVERSAAHRDAKSATLPYEDEKYSYVTATRLTPVAEPRVLRHPVRRAGHVRLQLCDLDGASEVVVSKREGDRYRAARDARWGDRFPRPPPPPTTNG